MPRPANTRKELLNQMMKETIYSSAVTVLVEHGFDGMTMDRVAAAAGVAKGSLYNYFRDKRELVSFIHAKTVEPLLQAHDEVIRSDRPAVEKLRMILEILFAHMTKHREVMRVFIRDDALRTFLEPTERGILATALEQTTAVFQQGIREGVFRPCDPTTLAQLYVGAVVELVDRRVAAGGALEGEALTETILGVFFHGIAVR